MSIIGIVCNPQSGKDIRRLFTAATTIDDMEKQNILERILLSAAALGKQKVYIMPDRLGYGNILIRKGSMQGYPGDLSQLEVYDMIRNETQRDSIVFASEMEKIGADVLIVMGGDGTSRAVAKGTCNVPTISLSTGTNNVYPELMEATVAGIAAAVVAQHAVDISKYTYKAKRIHIYKNGEYVDMALIDLVFCRNPFTGAKAIWDYKEIDSVIVTQCSISSIGFSALVGTNRTITAEDDFGAAADFTDDKPNKLSPVGAGIVEKIHICNERTLQFGEKVEKKMMYQGTLAMDGEREIFFDVGDVITCVIERDGPIRVKVKEIIEAARNAGFFDIRN